MQKIWKPITGYEGLYEVSNYGEIRSVDRLITYKTGNKYRVKGRVLKSGASGTGYLQCNLCANGKRKTVYNHKIVAQEFLGHTPTKGKVVDHIDNNRINNRLDNLQIISQRENCTKEMRNGLLPGVSVPADMKNSIKRFRAIAYINGKNKHLGNFATEQEAHEAYLAAIEGL